MNKKSLLWIFIILFLKTGYLVHAQDVGLIINEFNSTLDTGSVSSRPEYIELLVVGCPGRGTYVGNDPDILGPDPSTVDLRGWIIDDDNGDFSATGAVSVTQGHIRFADNPAWENVPVGSIILIYNTAGYTDDMGITIPPVPDDPTDESGNLVYVLGINATDLGGNHLLEFCADLPSTTDRAYQGVCTGNYTPTDINSWQYIALRNDGDGYQTREPNADFFHGISYSINPADPVNGGDNLALPIGERSIHIENTSGANQSFSFTNPTGPRNDNYRDVATYSGGAQTPSASNSLSNGAYINQFKQSTDAGPDDVHLYKYIYYFSTRSESNLD